MISPIGSLLVRFDGALTSAVDSLVGIMANYASTPLILTATVFYTIQGLKLANGDSTPLHNFVPQLLRIGCVLFFATNMDTFNYYVRGVLMDGLPAALGKAVTTGTGSAATGVNATGALLDSLYDQIWFCVSSCWALAGFSLTGLVAGLAGLMTVLAGGFGLVLLGLIIVGARFTLGVVVILGPALIGCAIFDYTRPFFDRAVGYVIAAIILIAAAAITVNIMVLGSQWFMARATEGIITASTNAAAGYETTQILMTLCLWFVASGWMMLQLRPLAHSIGGGIASSTPSLLGLALLARGGDNKGSDNSPNTPPAPSLGLDMARRELGSEGSQPALPPPPPPSITNSTRNLN